MYGKTNIFCLISQLVILKRTSGHPSGKRSLTTQGDGEKKKKKEKTVLRRRSCCSLSSCSEADKWIWARGWNWYCFENQIKNSALQVPELYQYQFACKGKHKPIFLVNPLPIKMCFNLNYFISNFEIRSDSNNNSHCTLNAINRHYVPSTASRSSSTLSKLL